MAPVEQETLKTEIELKIEAEKQRFLEKKTELEKGGTVEIQMELFSEKDKEGNLTGKVFAAFFKQPAILVAARAMDMQFDKKHMEAGLHLWENMFLRDSSSPEIEKHQKYKLSLLGRLPLILDLVAPDVKKS